MENIKKLQDYNQVCVWEGTTVGSDKKDEFIDFLQDEFKVRGQYLEEILTLPDDTPNSGGRSDLFFSIHKEDVEKFAVPRFQFGIRWIEDVLDNQERRGNLLYDDRVKEYRTW